MVGVADLKYAYDWQWSPPWPKESTTYAAHWEHETTDPHILGWPGNEEWFPTTLHGLPDFGFTGMYMWRRPYNPVEKAFRTVLMARGAQPYVLIVDDIQKSEGAHNYEWYLHLCSDIKLENVSGNDIVLAEDQGARRMLVRLLETPATFTAQVQKYSKSNKNGATASARLIVSMTAVAPNFKIMLFPHTLEQTLPASRWRQDTLSIGQDDEFTFSHSNNGRGRFVMKRNGRMIISN